MYFLSISSEYTKAMNWQDILLMLGGFVFAVALIPTLRSAEKPPRSTCILTALVLAAYAVAYVSLDLWLAFSAVLITKGMWLAILIFRKPRRKVGFVDALNRRK